MSEAGAPRVLRRRWVGLLAVVVLLAVALLAVVAVTSVPAAAAPPPTGLHVAGNRLLNGAGDPIVLRGVNRSGTEYMCVQGHGIFDGPDDDVSIAAIAAWHVNAVRVPLNEDCWLGLSTAPTQFAGERYRAAIAAYVTRLHAAGLAVVLDLHWSNGAEGGATRQQPMADAAHAPDFWRSVATRFAADRSVVFDLFNEPHGVSWTCWRDGGDCGVGYPVAGMQTLVDAVRSTGALNPVLVGGLAWANDMSGWSRHRPSDPAGNLLASWHAYGDNSCVTAACWDAQVAPVLGSVPLVATEVGERDCAHGFLDTLLPWLDRHGAGYLAWAWNSADCAGFPALVTDASTGAPTAYGVGFRDHLADLAAGSLADRFARLVRRLPG